MAIIEGILVNSVTEIMKKLIPFIIENICLAKGFKNELKNLQETLEMILTVIVDAEAKQVHANAVNFWLKRLKDVAYEADDVLDDFAYELMRWQHERIGKLDKVSDFVSKSSNSILFGWKMGRRIKKINQKLRKIVNDADIKSKLLPSSTFSAAHRQNSDRRRCEWYKCYWKKQ